MRTREKNFLDIDALKEVYSFQVLWKGKWMFVSDGKGGPLRFDSSQARDEARDEARKQPAPEEKP